MVAKPSGKIHVCVDYRGLNQATVPDAHLPFIVDDLLYVSGGCKYLATVDLRLSLWQIPLMRENRDKTAFIFGHAFWVS